MIVTLTALASLLCVAAAAALFACSFRRSSADIAYGRLRRMMDGTPAADRIAPEKTWVSDPARFIPAWLCHRVRQAGLEAHGRIMGRMALGAGLVCFAAAYRLGALAAFLIFASLVAIGVAMLDYVARRRMLKLGGAMRGYFERVRQLLITGSGLSKALSRAAQGSPPLVAEFFTPAMRRIANGAALSESVEQLADVSEIYEMHLFAAAVATNSRFGGSLAAVLGSVIENIRRRASVEREVRVATAQVRMSAWILGLLPLLVAALVMSSNHEYARWFIVNPLGRKMLAYCALSQIAGAWIMRLMIRTKY